MPTDYTTRGKKGPSPIGSATFVGLRALDPFIQHSILARGTGRALIEALGSGLVDQGPTSNTGYAFLDNLNLSPYRLVLFGMAAASSAKHIFWKLFIGEEEMNPGMAAGVGAFNTFFNSVNNLLFICRATSVGQGRGEGPNWPGWPGRPLVIGSTLFTVGLLMETLAEIQRKNAKRDPLEQGKPYTRGLFALTRHPNYAGYTLWRTGYALASGGWIWAGIVGAFFTYDFSARAIPVLEDYCETRYGDMWHDYTLKVKSKLFPFIY